MPDDLKLVRRYELKYLIAEETAQEIRDHIRKVCVLDSHADPTTCTYIVNNIYFDTPDLRFYHDTRFRKLTRFKPRARYYGDACDCIFPELKYRHGSIIWKTRYKTTMSEWRQLFNGRSEEHEEPVIKRYHDTFDEVIRMYAAEPTLQVRYIREPYVTQLEDYGRVTFDRRLTSRLAFGSYETDLDDDFIFYDDAQSMRCDDSMVVLEIKVETNVPRWVIELVRKFDLVQTGFSKYCTGIEHHTHYRATERTGIHARNGFHLGMR